MRLLHLIDSAGLYGAERVLLALCEAQRRAGTEPIIGSICEPHQQGRPLDAAARNLGLTVQSFPMRTGVSLHGMRSLLRFAQDAQVDLIHSHGYKSDILLGLARMFAHTVPVVATVHGFTASGSGFSKLRAYEWLDRHMLRTLDAVVFVSNAMRRHPAMTPALSAYGAVIHNGLTADSSHQTPRSPTPLERPIIEFCQRRFTIGAIGRLSVEKGFDVLIRALAVLRASDLDVQVVLLGEGPERPALENLARELKVDDRLLLAGYVPDASNLLPHFQVCALTSHTEGLPMVVLEAAIAGVPQVATDVGGVTEVLENGVSGLVTAPNAPGETAAALAKLYQSPELRQRVARVAADVARQRFSIEAMRARYDEVYRRVSAQPIRQ
jgi:glycosyltransferase involved in cell wall biosynthesis